MTNENKKSTLDWGERFRRETTIAELAKNYEDYKAVLRAQAEAIRSSSEARKYIQKNLKKEDPKKLLVLACRCLADLTGDRHFGEKVAEVMEEEAKHEQIN